MTTERIPPTAVRSSTVRRRRSHPARSARIITTGAACTLTFGVVAALAVNEPVAPPPAAANAAIDPAINAAPTAIATNLDTSVASTARPVTVIRRIHVLPAPSAAVTDVGTSAPVAAPALAAPAPTFAPLPAIRPTGQSSISKSTARSARPHRTRTQAVPPQPVRRAKARSRAS